MGSEGSQWVVFPQNSGDPDEIPHCVAFHQGLHGLPRQNRSSDRERNTIFSLKLHPLTPQYIQWTILKLILYEALWKISLL